MKGRRIGVALLTLTVVGALLLILWRRLLRRPGQPGPIELWSPPMASRAPEPARFEPAAPAKAEAEPAPPEPAAEIAEPPTGSELVAELLPESEPTPEGATPAFEPEQMTESEVVTPAEALAIERDDGMPVATELIAEPMEEIPAWLPEAVAPAVAQAESPEEPGPSAVVEAIEEAPTARGEEPFAPVAAETSAPVAEERGASAAEEQVASAPAEGTIEPVAAEADQGLAASLEEALADVAPAPIIPPPRATADRYLDEGNVYFNVGQYGLAIDRYNRAVELDSQLVAGFYNRANAQTRAGDLDAALADYDRALALQPRDSDALNNRGMLHLYRGDYGHALADFDAAIAVDPGDTTVLVNRGLAYLHGGDANRALADFRAAAGMDPADAAAQYGAAQAFAALGNREEALRYVGRALIIDAGYAREAAGDPRLAILEGDQEFLRLLREAGARQ